MRVAVITLVVLLTACGSQGPPARRGPIAPAEWKAVLNDWYTDAVVDHPHPCAAIVIAIEHLPVDGMIYSTINRDLARAEARWCPHTPSLDALRKGMSDADVAARAGVPRDAGPKCWRYDARRICFTGGRVTTLQFSQHG